MIYVHWFQSKWCKRVGTYTNVAEQVTCPSCLCGMEIAAQHSVQRTARKRHSKKDYFNPRDVAILGGDPSL